MKNRIFVDETKQRGYFLVAGAVVPGDIAKLRRELGSLVLPGQRGLHMKDERDPRRRAIVDLIVSANVHAIVYDAGKRFSNEPQRRSECFRELVNDIASKPGETHLVIDRDDSLVQNDRKCLIEFSRMSGCRDQLRYEHLKTHEEQLLIVPDAIAWCWAKGGDWRRRVRPVVKDVRQIG